MSLFFSWKLTLIASLAVPLVLAASYFELKYTALSALNEKQAIEQGCKIAVEAISNIKTVASLGQENYILNRYSKELDNAKSACRRTVRFRGTVFGTGQTVPLFGYAIALYYGGILVANNEMHYKDVIK